jgi:esterase
MAIGERRDGETVMAHYRSALDRAGMSETLIELPLDRFVQLDSIQLHMLEWPDRSGRASMFLHGAGLTAHTWDLVCLSLPELRCLSVDLRGHGDSDWSDDLKYGIGDHVSDMEALGEHLGYGNYIVVGMSLGAMVALGYALRRPDKVAGLVLVDVSPAGPGFGRRRIRDFIDGMVEFESIEDCVVRALEFNPLRDRQQLEFTLPQNLRRLPSGRFTWKYDRRHRGGDAGAKRLRANAEVRERLWRSAVEIRCPVLVVRGANSDMTTEIELRSFVENLSGWKYVEIPDAGHTVQGDNPKRLSEVIAGFIERAGIA